MTLILAGECKEGILVCHDTLMSNERANNLETILKFRKITSQIYVGIAGDMFEGGPEDEFRRIKENSELFLPPKQIIEQYLTPRKLSWVEIIQHYRNTNRLHLLGYDENTFAPNQYLIVITESNKPKLYKNDKLGEVELVSVPHYGIGYANLPEIMKKIESIPRNITAKQLLEQFMDIFNFTNTTKFKVVSNGKQIDYKPQLQGFVVDFITEASYRTIFSDDQCTNYQNLKVII